MVMPRPEVIVAGVPGPTGATGATGPAGAAAIVTSTSSSTHTIGTGSKAFTVTAGMQIGVGAKVLIARTAAPTTHWMFGTVTAYSGTTLTVNVEATLGTGSYNAWTVSLAGVQGVQGPAGTNGNVATVSDTASIDHTLSGGNLSSAVIFPASSTTGTNGDSGIAARANHHHHLPMVAGIRYSNIDRGFGAIGALASYVMPAGRLNFAPIYIPHAATFDEMGCIINTAVASSLVRLGIFTFDRAANLMTRVHDAGTVSGASAGYSAVSTSVVLQQGWYWLGMQGNGSPNVSLINNAAATGVEFNTSGTTVCTMVTTGQAWAAFPATITTTSISGGLWPIALRVA